MRRSLLIMLFLCNLAGAATYTIGSDVSDDYTSWANFHAAVATPAAGSVISFRKGDTFREMVTVAASGSAGSPITYTSHGTGVDPIISGAELFATDGFAGPDGNGEHTIAATTEVGVLVRDGTHLTEGTAGSLDANEWDWDSDVLYVKEDPTGYTTFEGGQRLFGIYLNDKDYIIIQNLKVVYTNSDFIRARGGSANIIIEDCVLSHTGGHGIGLYHSADNSIVRNCNISYTIWYGINISTANNTIINDNTISYIQSSGIVDAAGNTGIEIYGNEVSYCGLGAVQVPGITVRGDNFEVYDNHVHDITNGEGIGIGYADSGNIYDNIISDTSSVGIYIDGGQNVNVFRNICTDNTTWGIACADELGTQPVMGVKIYYNIVINPTSGLVVTDTLVNNDIQDIEYYNNVCYGSSRGISIAGDGHTGIVFKNNIFLNSSSLCVRTELTSNLTLDNNCYYSTSGNLIYWNGVTYDLTQFATYQAATGQDAGSIFQEPLFVDAANDDFHLKSNSPCLGIGRYPWEFPLGRPRGSVFESKGNFFTRPRY